MKQILVTGASGQLGSEESVVWELCPIWMDFADRTHILDKLAVLKEQLETFNLVSY
jgi:hypothetical protein